MGVAAAAVALGPAVRDGHGCRSQGRGLQGLCLFAGLDFAALFLQRKGEGEEEGDKHNKKKINSRGTSATYGNVKIPTALGHINHHCAEHL